MYVRWWTNGRMVKFGMECRFFRLILLNPLMSYCTFSPNFLNLGFSIEMETKNEGLSWKNLQTSKFTYLHLNDGHLLQTPQTKIQIRHKKKTKKGTREKLQQIDKNRSIQMYSFFCS